MVGIYPVLCLLFPPYLQFWDEVELLTGMEPEAFRGKALGNLERLKELICNEHRCPHGKYAHALCNQGQTMVSIVNNSQIFKVVIFA